MAASIRDVAKRAGVSISTVSRIINNSAGVNEKKAAAVREAIEYLHYEPNQFGRGLVKQTSHMIGVYFPYGPPVSDTTLFDSTYNLELLKGIGNVLAHQGYNMVLISESNDYEKQASAVPKYLECIKQKRIDGLLLGAISDRAEKDMALQQLVDDAYPVAYIGRRFYDGGINVYAQFEQYYLRMLKVLMSRGHRRIIFYMDYMHAHYFRSIQAEALRSMPELTLYPVILKDFHSMPEKLLMNLQLHVSQHGCTAVCSPAMAWTQILVSGCAQLGLHIPDQISVISAEHRLGEGEALFPKISAFYVPARAMGKAAAQLLLREICKEPIEKNSVEFVTEYIERESIGRGE